MTQKFRVVGRRPLRCAFRTQVGPRVTRRGLNSSGGQALAHISADVVERCRLPRAQDLIERARMFEERADRATDSISRQHYREKAAHYRNLPVEFQDISPRPARVLAQRRTNEAVSTCYGCERLSQQRPVADDQKLPHDPVKSPTKSRRLRAAPHE